MLIKTNFAGATRLGESQEDYLEAIFVLSNEQHPVRVKDIARYLAVSRPSVVNAITALSTKGLVKHEYYGGVELTPRGKGLADAIYRRHRLLEYFLCSVLGVSKHTAFNDACRLEHTLSRETLIRLQQWLESQRRKKGI